MPAGDVAGVLDERCGPEIPAVGATVVLGGDEMGAAGREARHHAESGKPGSGAPSAWPLATSHKCAVPSALPVASVELSGLNASQPALPPDEHAA